jgi:hypothetical protein
MSWFSKAIDGVEGAADAAWRADLDGAKGDQVVRLIPTDPQGWAPDHTAAGVCVTTRWRCGSAPSGPARG